VADPATPQPPIVAEPSEPDTIKQLALSGVATTLGRTVGVRAIGLVLNIFLARILAPEDFGELALGLTLYTALNVFANAGLGASLVRRPEPPASDELATVFGAQLTLSVVGAAIVGGLAAFFPAPALVLAALFLCALPIQALRTPALIQLERRLEYTKMATVDVIDCTCQALFAVALVLAGMGVYGVALAQPLGIVVGTAALLSWRAAPLRRPRLVLSEARPLLRVGALLGAGDATNLARDLTVNWGTAAIAGASVLGTWSFSTRLAALGTMAIQALGHVTYSAVPRLHAAGGSAQGVVVPILRLTTIGVGAPLAVLAGCSPLFVPLVLGNEWMDVSVALPLMCLALLIAGPVSVSSVGYLFAHGRVGRILCAQIAHSLVTVALGLALLPTLGVAALGVATCAAGLTDASILGTATLKDAEAGYLRTVGPLLVCTLAIGGASFVCAQSVDPSWISLIVLVAATLAGYALALLACARADSRRLWRLVGSAFSRSTAPA
jgi:O-antigen/teichoic acid export membrane protein